MALLQSSAGGDQGKVLAGVWGGESGEAGSFL